MGTVLDTLISKFLKKLGELITDEVVMTLSVSKDIKRLEENLEDFRAVREDAEALAMENGVTKLWWKRISDVMFNVDDVIELFLVHSQKHFLPPGPVCCNQAMSSYIPKLLVYHRLAKRIKAINKELDEIKKKTDMFTPGRPSYSQSQITIVDTRQTAPIDQQGVIGTDIRRAVDRMVQNIVSIYHENRPRVFGIQGMGGIGKTTLAQKIYYDQRVRNEFQVHIWLCISQSYKENELVAQAIRLAGGKNDQLDKMSKGELLTHLLSTIRGKNVFLVLDDVWRSDVWNSLLRSAFEEAFNACVLVTTRNQDVLTEMHTIDTHLAERMNERDGLELLMNESLQPHDQRSKYIDVGAEIVRKCDGLPLAIKVVAGVLSSRRTVREWQSIRDSKWSIDGLPNELGGLLYVSYSNLPQQLKQCFLWCALLPSNFSIKRDAVAYWWVAEGFVRKEHEYSIYEIAEDYYHELIRRNLLQAKPEFVDKGKSTMHDLLRSLGQYLSKDHSLFMDVENNSVLRKLRRLGISSAVEEIPALEEHKFLRTLLLFDNKNFKSVQKETFRKLQYIRVLVLSSTSIQNIPESVGNLVLLRLLDLSHTEINKLPESIGSLFSLEYLSLRGCRQLNSLPTSFMRLYKISCLELEDTAINHIPKGLAKFQQLYYLKGVFESGAGFQLDELQCLPNIQRLRVEKLEKATPAGALVLQNCSNLRDLGLRCTMGMGSHCRTRYQVNEIERIQLVYDMLLPSPSLVYIFIDGFPGKRFPDWLWSEPEHKMPNLCHMHLNDCILCSELPPAGQIPELSVLQIKGADAVVKIGAELLGEGVTSVAAFFPKLELLHIMSMCNLESWSLNTGNLCCNMKGNSKQLYLMPCLTRLLLLDCPKLRALPEDLHRAVKLARIHIEGAHKLEEVVNLPAVVWLKVKNNTCLKRISNLCKLQDLFAQDCPQLNEAQDLHSLKRSYMVDCPKAQEFSGCLQKEQDVLIHVATIGADGRNIFLDESLYN